MFENERKKNVTFNHSSVSLHCFIFLICATGVIILNILDSLLNFPLHLVKLDRIRMDLRADPDLAKFIRIRPDPDPQHRIFKICSTDIFFAVITPALFIDFHIHKPDPIWYPNEKV